METERQGRIYAGLVLVLLGAGLLALQLVEGTGSAVVIFVIGALFLAGYFYRRSYGLLVAGGILIGLALGQMGEEAFSLDGVNSVGLGVGFLSIYVIDRAYAGSTAWWPLIPGGILLLTGLGSLGEPATDVLAYAWPILLILGGLIIIFGIHQVRR